MQEINDLNPAERELESVLAQLHPSNVQRSRDEVIYLAGVFAGKRAARLPIRIWQSLAAILAISVAVSLVPRRAERQPIAQSSLPTVVTVFDSTPQPYSAISLRDAVMSRGIDGLPSAFDDAPTGPTPTVGGFVTQ